MKDELKRLGIDADDAIRRFAGKEALFIKSLKKFVVDITTNGVKSLDEAMAMETEDFGKYIHGLKGVTANLSMTDANKLLIEIEQTVKAGAADFSKYENFCTMFPLISFKVLSLIEAEEVPLVPIGAATGSEAECRENLRLLRECLERGMARECDEITKKLRANEWDYFEKALLLKICDKADNYDYAGALEMIDDLR
ncbi:MAG: hypothetical protein FWG91_06110 [Lachnospiraceae bacterium]|nr:hypothetical protein [Lachnospiraceae bacterium]